MYVQQAEAALTGFVCQRHCRQASLARWEVWTMKHDCANCYQRITDPDNLTDYCDKCWENIEEEEAQKDRKLSELTEIIESLRDRDFDAGSVARNLIYFLENTLKGKY
jgi:elongation factor P--beta-lysine ligase